MRKRQRICDFWMKSYVAFRDYIRFSSSVNDHSEAVLQPPNGPFRKEWSRLTTHYIYRYAIEKAHRRFTKHNPQFLYGNEVSSILRWLTSFPSPTPSRLRWCNRSQKAVCKKGGKLGEYARKRRVLKVFSFLKKGAGKPCLSIPAHNHFFQNFNLLGYPVPR